MLSLIGKKVGMTQVFDETGVLTPVTVVKVEENVVIANKSIEKDGYEAVVLGSIERKEKHTTKPVAGQFKEGVTPKRKIVEVRDFGKECAVGDTFGVELIEGVEFVDVIGTSKGKGYQGVMKRHNFGGGRKTHGSKFHRANGSTGMAATPSRVIKGTKMAGRMGGERKTVQNLQVVKIDTERQVLLIKGAVPGTKDSFVIVRKAKKL
ncbi:MAG: 50S ribosomal protein L3 [Spirochaetales bacterium]|nr:50S ribosomal protein L3 [Spirochaetales bacterium]